MGKKNSFEKDLAAARSGDKKAYARLYKLVYELLYQIAFLIMGEKEHALEVVYRNAAFTYRDLLRAVAVKTPDQYRDYMVACLIDICMLYEKECRMEGIVCRGLLGKIPAAQRAMVALKTVCGYPPAQIAEILDVDVTQVLQVTGV